MSYAALLDRTVTVQRQTGTIRSGSGNTTREYTTVTAAAVIAAEQATGLSGLTDPGRVSSERWFVTCEVATDIRDGDRIVMEGVTYEVTRMENFRGHHLEGEMRRVAVSGG